MKIRAIFYSLILLSLISQAHALKCAHEFDSSPGTCILKTYNLLMGGGQAYYSCDISINNRWYFHACTATVSSGTIITEHSSSIVAEHWSNDADKVSACAGRDGWLCNVNPMYGFKSDHDLGYAGFCDSSEETCVKCSEYNTEIKKFDGTGMIKTIINGQGNGLCESGCGASIECDEKAQGYNEENRGCTNYCQWNECNNYRWNNASSVCFESCQSNTQCFSSAVCDLIINPNTCVVDNENPKYFNVGQYDLTPTPDNSLITGDLILLSSYWTDNLYLTDSILELEINGSWTPYMSLTGIDSANSWTNYTIDTSIFSEESINWRITAIDRAGNTNTTNTNSFYVYSESANFTISLNLNYGNYIDFVGWASAELNKKPENSAGFNVAEIVLTHEGRGIASKYSFKLNESLPGTMNIKLSNNPNANNLLVLSDEFQHPSWCSNEIRGDECRIWVWMDLDYGNDPQEQLRSIIIKNEKI